MKITKFTHCCLLIESNGTRILTDPGNLSKFNNKMKNLDAILITHEHADHFHIPMLRPLLKKNPNAEVITNKSVSNLLISKKITCKTLNHGESYKIKSSNIKSIEGKHEEIYKNFMLVQNTGFLIDGKLFYPGDSFSNPGKSIEVLALPVAGPWCKISDAINYALKLKPKIVFPVHDGALKNFGGTHKVPELILQKNGIQFNSLENNSELVLE